MTGKQRIEDHHQQPPKATATPEHHRWRQQSPARPRRPNGRANQSPQPTQIKGSG